MKASIASTQYQLTASDMETLLALVRGKTLAEAALRLGADASTVFRAVQRIERQLGQRLFERTRGGYLAGDAVQDIARHAERIEAELEAARAVASGPGDAVSGRVRLTTTDSVLRALVLPLLPALAQQHPRLQIELRSGNELASLTRRDADIALRATQKAPDHLVGRQLGTVRFVVAAQASAGKRKRAQAASPTDFAALPWIAPDEALPEHPSVRWRKRHLPKLQPRFLVDGITDVADAIAAGLGIGIVPRFMLAQTPGIVALTEELEGCESALWLLAHPESRHLRRIAVVYQALAEGVAMQ